jgi:uncharacterized protein
MILPGIVNHHQFWLFCRYRSEGKWFGTHLNSKQALSSDVNEVVKLHQHVTVKVTEVDEDRKRIQLTMKIV